MNREYLPMSRPLRAAPNGWLAAVNTSQKKQHRVQFSTIAASALHRTA